MRRTKVLASVAGFPLALTFVLISANGVAYASAMGESRPKHNRSSSERSPVRGISPELAHPRHSRGSERNSANPLYTVHMRSGTASIPLPSRGEAVYAENTSQEEFDKWFPLLGLVNPKFNSGDERYRLNCRDCAKKTVISLATGRPFEAKPARPNDPLTRENLTKLLIDLANQGQRIDSPDSFDDVVARMLAAGDRKVGILMGYWNDPQTGKFSVGHASSVLSLGGKVYFLDGQRGGGTKLNDNYNGLLLAIGVNEVPININS
jgi:hypothetical protein